MKVAAVVPHWNRSDLLGSLLANLAQQTRPFGEIIIVDNGSQDDSVAAARRAGATVIEFDRNLGFAAAVNRGIQAATSDWVAILNNDVFLNPDWLQVLEARFPDADYITGKLLASRNLTIIDGTFDELSLGLCLPLRRWQAGWTGMGQAQPIRIAPMTAALFRRGLFAEIGLLDEIFESYLEDVDFGLRCALAGKRGFYEPAARAVHQGSATTGAWHSNTVRLLARNQMLLSAKHFQGQPVWPQVAGQMLWGLVALRHGRFFDWCQGKWQGWRLGRTIKGRKLAGLTGILEQSERHIFELQRRTGFDLYWRMYFWLRGADHYPQFAGSHLSVPGGVG